MGQKAHGEIEMITKEQVIEVAKNVKDPELGLDIWTLGLVYEIDLEGKNAKIKMTLTSPTCPFGEVILEELRSSLINLGLKNPIIELVFDPPWQPSDELRAMLGV